MTLSRFYLARGIYSAEELGRRSRGVLFRQSGLSFGYQVAVPINRVAVRSIGSLYTTSSRRAVLSIRSLFRLSGRYFFNQVAVTSTGSSYTTSSRGAISSIRSLFRLSGRCFVNQVPIPSIGSSYTTSSRRAVLSITLFRLSGRCFLNQVAVTSTGSSYIFIHDFFSWSYFVNQVALWVIRSLFLITWLFGQSGLHIHLVLAAPHLLLDRRFATGSSSSSGKAVSLGEVNTSV